MMSCALPKKLDLRSTLIDTADTLEWTTDCMGALVRVLVLLTRLF
jgi:hypothetical protein